MFFQTLRELKKSKGEMLLLFAILAIAAWLRIRDCDVGYFSFHAARDLYRSQCLLNLRDIPLWGSELQYGGRTFGPFVYVIYAIPLAIKCTTYSVALFIALYNLFTIFMTYIFARRCLGAKAALFASAFYACFPLEISQIRFFWNPVFLPLTALLFFWGISLLAMKDKEWGLVLSVFSFFLGFNIHFSAFVLLPFLILAIFLKRKRISPKVWLASAAIFAIFIIPPVIGSIKTDLQNVKEVVESPRIGKEKHSRLRFNPNASIVFSHHLRFTYREKEERMGLVYLGFVREYLESVGRTVPRWIRLLEKIGWLQFILWILGFGAALLRGLNFGKIDDALARLHDAPNRWVYRFLVLWQFIPWLLLSFFNLQQTDTPSEHAAIAMRYFLIAYPATFITMGLGVAALMDYFQKRRAFIPAAALCALIVILLVGQAAFGKYHVDLMRDSGKALPYNGFCPNQREMQKAANALIYDFKMNAEDFYTKVFSMGVYTWTRGEASLDWNITQNTDAWKNPRLPADRYILLYEDKDKDLPFKPEQIIKSKKLYDVNLALIQIPEDASPPPLDNAPLINFWIKHMTLLILPWQR